MFAAAIIIPIIVVIVSFSSPPSSYGSSLDAIPWALKPAIRRKPNWLCPGSWPHSTREELQRQRQFKLSRRQPSMRGTLCEQKSQQTFGVWRIYPGPSLSVWSRLALPLRPCIQERPEALQTLKSAAFPIECHTLNLQILYFQGG